MANSNDGNKFQDEKSKFLGFNRIFVCSTDSVNFKDLQSYLMPRIARNQEWFPKGTVFYLITGFHHAKSAIDDNLPDRTDPSLSQNFHYALFRNLMNFCGNMECVKCTKGPKIEECESSVWDDMGLRVKLVQLYTEKQKDRTFRLSKFSEIEIKNLAKDLCNQKEPSALLFASCYSMHSNIRDILSANGVMAALNISKDKGEVSDGRAFQLDDQQNQIINWFRDVNT